MYIMDKICVHVNTSKCWARLMRGIPMNPATISCMPSLRLNVSTSPYMYILFKCIVSIHVYIV